jgi:hypothetical protein
MLGKGKDDVILPSSTRMRPMNVQPKLAAIVLSFGLSAATPAWSTGILELIDNEGHFAQVTGTDPTLTLSVNNLSGSFAGSPWSLAIAVGTNGVSIGIPDISFDLTANAARAGSLTAIYSLNNLSYGAGAHMVSVNSLISSAYTSGILWQVCIDDGNVLTAQTMCTGYAGMDAGSLALPNSAVNGLFSLTVIGRLVDTSSTRLSLTAAQTVPEPGTLLLFAVGLILASAVSRRRLG